MSNVELLMTRSDVAAYTGLTIETIKTYRRDGVMPEPDHIYDQKPLWKRSTIDAWRKK
jgi:hypothetical protein